MSKSVLVYDFSRVLQLYLQLGLLIHFDIIFVDGVKNCSVFILLIAIQAPRPIMKGLFFLHCIFFAPFIKDKVPIDAGLFQGFLSCSIDIYLFWVAIINVLITVPL